MIFPQGDEPASGEISVTCQSDSDCGEHGNCHEFAVHGQTVEGVNFPKFSVKVCKCEDGWVTTDKAKPCGYPKRSGWTAFFISFFAGEFGADWFWLDNDSGAYTIPAIIKLLLLTPFIGELKRNNFQNDDALEHK